MSNPGVQHLAWDAFGNLAQQRHTEAGLTSGQGFDYDGEDRLSALATAAGRAIAQVRDADGLAAQVLGVVAGTAATVVKSLISQSAIKLP